jgi:hypothetical protein
MFNILILVSRTSNSFQAPLLAKRVEENISSGALGAGTADFRWLLASATLATVVGAVMIPTFQRLFARWVEVVGRRRSLSSMFRHAASPAMIAHVRDAVVMPRWGNVRTAGDRRHIPWAVVAVNTFAMAVWSVGVFAALYAGYLRPELRVTASQMSAVVNGVATILMFVFIDPYLSLMSDDVAHGRVDEPYFRRAIVWLTGSRLAGTVLAQVILWIVTIADWL